jgi:hypothetical protein
MPLFRRYEGVLVKGLSAERKMLPFLMKGRNEAIAFLEQQIDVTALLAFLKKANAGLPKKKYTFFQALLCAMVRAMGMRPQMNRFISGGRLYQRKWIDFSFSLKKEMSDDGQMGQAKIRFEPDDTLSDVAERIQRVLERSRSTKESASEKEMAIVTSLPPFLIRFIVWALRKLDSWNLMPGSMIDADELYASLFVANLGSFGLETPYHHLYEWGTIPIFGTVGKIYKGQVTRDNGEVEIRDLVSIKWSLDERAVDGFYCARTLDLFKEFIANPEVLEHKPEKPASAAVPGVEAERAAAEQPRLTA